MFLANDYFISCTKIYNLDLSSGSQALGLNSFDPFGHFCSCLAILGLVRKLTGQPPIIYDRLLAFSVGMYHKSSSIFVLIE